MSTPNILELFNKAYRHSLSRLMQSGQVVVRGWWLLNEQDGWEFLRALEVAENADEWKRSLHAKAQKHGLEIILLRVSIVGLPIKYFYDGATTCVLQGKKN